MKTTKMLFWQKKTLQACLDMGKKFHPLLYITTLVAILKIWLEKASFCPCQGTKIMLNWESQKILKSISRANYGF
ncbi:MAG: hypothetical protein WC608_04515 [Parcubacteria group bacterium]